MGPDQGTQGPQQCTVPKNAYCDRAPLVVVEGFLCAASKTVWGDFARHLEQGAQEVATTPASVSLSPRPIVFAPVGPVSSIHDRACELFYALCGGRVDYGAQHAAAHGHGRYGRFHATPLLPGWATWSPDGRVQLRAHFIGHSLGGLTIIKLYDLLEEGFFDEALGLHSNDCDLRSASSAFLSITTISSPLRGTPLVYTLGLDPALHTPRLRFLSVGDCIAKYVHLVTWARRLPLVGWPLSTILPDFHADAWHFAGHSGPVRKDDSEGDVFVPAASEKHMSAASSSISNAFGLAPLLAQLWRSDWAEGTDCAPWDCTFQQRALLEAKGGIWFGEAKGSSEDNAVSSEDEVKGKANCTPPRSSQVWLRSYAATLSCFAPPSTAQADSVEHSAHRVGGPLRVLEDALANFDYSHCSPPQPLLEARRDQSPESQLTMESDSGYSSSASDTLASSEPTPSKTRASHRRRKVGAPIRKNSLVNNEKRDYAEWRANDGIVPLASQYHPGPCRQGHCTHSDDLHAYNSTPLHGWTLGFVRAAISPISTLFRRDHNTRGQCFEEPREIVKQPGELEAGLAAATQAASQSQKERKGQELITGPVEAGIWHVTRMAETSHVSLAPLWAGSTQQKCFWQDYGRWLSRVELSAAIED